MQPQGPNEDARGQNNFFPKHITFDVLRVTQIRVLFFFFTSRSFFANFTVLSMEFPIKKYLPFFFQINGNFYQMILPHILGRGPNNSMIKKKSNFIRDKAFRKG